MDNNTLNNHICQNSVRHIERELSARVDRNIVEKVLARRFENEHHENTEPAMCNSCENKCENEHGGDVFATNIGRMAVRNNNFRESIWTGKYLQLTLMSIKRGEEIGIELHSDTDQYIRVEHGAALAKVGDKEDDLDQTYRLFSGDAIFIPAGKWHNITNIGRCELKLSSVYAPPHHPKCTVEENK